MATLEQLYEALKRADAAGNTADATALANAIKTRRSVTAPPPQGQGLGANAIAASKDIAYALPGAPVDISRAAINAVTQPDDALGNALKTIPVIGQAISGTQALAGLVGGIPAVPDNTVGSSRWLAEQAAKVGVTDPALIKPVTLPEKALRSGMEAAAMTAAPELLLARLKQFGIVGDSAIKVAESMLGNAKSGAAVVRNAATGAAGGAGATVGYEVAPEPLKPLAATIGALTGGVGADLLGSAAVRGAKGAATKVGEFFDPMRGPEGIERTAARRLAEGLDATPEQAIAAIDAATPPVSGAKPTLAQATMDRGAATMEATAARVDDKALKARIAEQEAARIAMLKRIQQTGGAEDMAPALTTHAKRVDDLLEQIDTRAQTRGEQIAAELAAGRKDPATAGDEIRAVLESQRTAARRVESALHEAVDPDGVLTVKTNSLRGTHKRLDEQRSTMAKPLDSEEAAIVETVADLPPTASYRDLVALKSRIGDEMRTELRTKGRTAKWGRLSRYAAAASDDLKSPAFALAKQEAKAVKAGELAPEDTFLAKIREITDELDRNAASFGTDVAGDGAVIGGPPVTSLGDAGATRQAGLGPRNAAGSESVPDSVADAARALARRVAPTDVPRTDLAAPVDPAVTAQLDEAVRKGLDLAPEVVVDPDVAARLAAANEATIARVNTFDNPTLKPLLARPSSANPYTKMSVDVPATIFREGPKGGETVRLYRDAVGDEAAAETLEGFIVDSASRAAGRPDGTLDPKKLALWRQKHAEALESFPALDARVSNATTAAETAASVAAKRREVVKAEQKSIASRLAGATDPDEITTIVGKIFGRADSVTQMQALKRALRGNTDANAGLRKAIADHIFSKVTRDADALGTPKIAPRLMRDFLDENEQALKAAGFTHPEVENMRALADEAARAAEIATVKPPPSGPGQIVQDMLKIGVGANSTPTTLMGRMIIHSIGHAIIPFAFGGPFAGLATLIGAGAVNAMRAKGLQSVDELFREALLDPVLARKLLVKVNSKNLKPTVNAFRQQMTRSTLAGTAAVLMNPKTSDTARPPSSATPTAGTPASGYNTVLSPAKEEQFKAWKRQNAPNDSGDDYDLRGAFMAGVSPAANGHWPDTFKKPNHPTFSDQSQYARYAPDKAGHWTESGTYVRAGYGN